MFLWYLWFLEEISSLSCSTVFLYCFALIAEEGFLISPCYSLDLCIQMGLSFLFSFAFLHFFSVGMVLIPVSCTMSRTSIHSSSGTLSDLSYFKVLYIFYAYRGCKCAWFFSVFKWFERKILVLLWMCFGYAVFFIGGLPWLTLVLFQGVLLPLWGSWCSSCASVLMHLWEIVFRSSPNQVSSIGKMGPSLFWFAFL